MGGYGAQAIVQLPVTCYGSRAHLVEKPEYAVTLHRLTGRELAKVIVAAQENPGASLRKRKGKAIGKGKGRHLASVGKGAVDSAAVQCLD